MTAPRIKAGLGIELESSQSCSSSSSLLTRSGPNAVEARANNVSVDIRSSQGMQGLLSAEKGEGMVEFDVFSRGSGFREGQRIAPESVTPGGGSYLQKELPRPRPSGPRLQQAEPQPTLGRQDTILSHGVSPARASQELKSLLGNTNSKLKHGATVPSLLPSASSGRDLQTIPLEQAKSRARVEVDIMLESNACVQGDYLKGVVKIRIRSRSPHEPRIMIAEGKIRVIGFECITNVDDRHTFYHCAEPFSAISPDWDIPFESDLDQDGFAYAREGAYIIPFAMHLPLEGVAGNAKGALNINSGVSVRYIAMVSVKVKDFETGKRSIAHFYRDCEIWPRLDPSAVLASAPRPLQCTTSKNLFMGGSGNAKLTALLSRLYWVAGQRCYVKVVVDNDTKKTIKSLTLLLIRRITVFRPNPELDTGARGDPDACNTSTSYREVAETTLGMAQRAAKGHASTKGWWTGVDPGEKLEFSHFILIPPEALSITRSRLLEVEYSIRVSISAGPLTTDILVDLPIRIINFMSIDVPASFSTVSPGGIFYRRSLSSSAQANSADGSTPIQSRSRSDIGSLTKNERFDYGSMGRRSISADGAQTTDHRDVGHPEMPLNHDLGNLQDADNSDEEVDFVVGAARGQTDVDYDSCAENDGVARTHNSVSDLNAANSTTRTRVTRRRSKTTSSISDLRGTGSNSFAARVQERISNAESSLIATLGLQDDLTYSEATTPKPQAASNWSRLACKTPGIGSSLDDHSPSPSTCSVYTDTTIMSKESTAFTAASEQSQSAGLSFTSRANSSAELKTASVLDPDLGAKNITSRTEALKQSVSSNDVVNGNDDNAAADKTKLADKTSEVKKRIEALEEKMRNSL